MHCDYLLVRRVRAIRIVPQKGWDDHRASRAGTAGDFERAGKQGQKQRPGIFPRRLSLPTSFLSSHMDTGRLCVEAMGRRPSIPRRRCRLRCRCCTSIAFIGILDARRGNDEVARVARSSRRNISTDGRRRCSSPGGTRDTRRRPRALLRIRRAERRDDDPSKLGRLRHHGPRARMGSGT